MPLKQQPPRESPEGFIERLAHTLGVEVNASHVFAPPIERDGVTVIPVAKARYGFGGGGGLSRGESGAGGGGGAVIVPAGYIEIANGRTRYRAIRNPLVWVPVLAASGILAAVAALGLKNALRR